MKFKFVFAAILLSPALDVKTHETYHFGNVPGNNPWVF